MIRCKQFNMKQLILILMIMLVVFGNSKNSQSQQQQQQGDNDQRMTISSSYDGNANNNRLLQIQRQIIMTEQMLKLYTQRLHILYSLQKQLKSSSTQSQCITISSTYNQQQQQKLNDYGNINSNQQYNNQHSINNPHQILINKYTLITNKHSNLITNKHSNLITNKHNHHNKQNTNTPINQPLQQQTANIILLPPFIINTKQSWIKLIDQLNLQHKDKHFIAYYDFSHANRLLFYSLQSHHLVNSNSKHYHNKQSSQHQTNKYLESRTLYLSLQIKPNKIKTVKITTNLSSQSSNTTNTQSSRANLHNPQYSFQIQQQVTSYQSNPLISNNFKWHKALDFDNLIVGYINATIYIKGKQQQIQQININQHILHIHSINQYKLVYVTQKRIGVINVRSYLLTDQILYQYYLGNRTLVKNRHKQQQSQQQNNYNKDEQQQLDILLSNNNQQFKSNNSQQYWHMPYIKQYNIINAVSVYKIQQRFNQLLILLSNGDLLIYSNGKVSHSTNIGREIMTEFMYKRNKYNGDVNANDQMRIKMSILAGYNYLLITSNNYSKLLIYNITIPHLTLNKNNNHFFSFLTPKSTQLTCKYWMKIELNSNNNNYPSYKQKQQQYQIDSSNNNIVIDVRQSNINNKRSQLSQYIINKSSSYRNKQQVIVYFTYHHKQLQQQQQQQQNNLSPQQQYSTFKTIIQQHRLLVNLLESNNALTSSSMNSSQSGSRSYWWNVLMICMIVCGVIIFKKCKSSTTNKQISQEQLYQLPQGYRPSKLKSQFNSNKSKHTLLLGNNNNKSNKVNPTNNKTQQHQQSNIPSSVKYQDKIISQLQSYLSKQGQQLSKQQIQKLIQDMQHNQSQQQHQHQSSSTTNNNSKKMVRQQSPKSTSRTKQQHQSVQRKKKKL